MSASISLYLEGASSSKQNDSEWLG